MSSHGLSPRAFYTKTVPTQWNDTLASQATAAIDDEAARRLLDDMRAVSLTVRVDVEGTDGGTFFLNVLEGTMASEEAPAATPLLTVLQDRRAFERIAAEAGDSALGLLGGLSGLAGDFKLTRSRLDNLRGISGCLAFEVTGEEGFGFRIHFGSEPVPSSPDAAIRVGAEVYRDLRAGRLDPQNAFMSGQLDVSGDLQMAMQLALAALSPE
jgi:hypothetical protein